MTASMICDLINISPRFMRSTQLERDFMDPQALTDYIVTKETINHIHRLRRSFQSKSGQRAWRITGDYGSGKSSFALVVANLLSQPANVLSKPVRALREDLGLDRNTSKLMPVLVTGTREPISRALLRALLKSIINNVDDRKKLKSKIHLQKLLASKSFTEKEAISVVETCSRELLNNGLFGGVVIILDELGKFLEYAAINSKEQDIYFLQLLGEISDRSGNAPIITLGLLHQGFAAYADKLSDSAQREWEKVAGRFEELVFMQPLSQVATLLAAALCVTVSRQPRGWKTKARQDMDDAVDLGIFGPTATKTELTQLTANLYPIHATVVPVLARFFRRFGQNERSLFSFLLSSEPYALQDFATREALPESSYRLADFYDFAAHNFSHRLSSQSFRSHWNHIDAMIRCAHAEPEEDLQLIKTVGILNVIESAELSPTSDLISLALGHPQDLAERLNLLCLRNILFNRGGAGYALWPYTSVNLEQAVLNARESVNRAPPIAEVVRSRIESRPVVARRHYIQTGNLRHFDVIHMTSGEFSIQPQSVTPKCPADGTIIVVLCETSHDCKQAESVAKQLEGSSQVLVAISAPLEHLSGFALDLEQWHWVEKHIPELKDDRFATEEVSRQIVTLAQLLQNRIQEYVGLHGTKDCENKMLWYHCGKLILSLSEGGSLQPCLSDFFDEWFAKAPKIKNELVNRYFISSAAAAARQKLFKLMLEANALPDFGLPSDKAPPEKSMYLSVLKASRLHRETKNGWRITFPERLDNEDPCCLRPALDAIVTFLEQQKDARIKLDCIWDVLQSPPLGVRKGLIPILILAVLIEYESEIAVYEDGRFQPEIEENLMMRLVKHPQTFELQLCRITGIRRQLLAKLAEVVEADCAEKMQLLAIVKPLYLFVSTLPEYARYTLHLSERTLKLRLAIMEAREPSELVFKAIPKALGYDLRENMDNDPVKMAKTLSKSITELRRAFPELQTRMGKAILEAFGESDLNLQEWRTNITERAETILVGVIDGDLRSFSLKLLDDNTAEPDWLETLGSLLTRCPPSRWKDKDEKIFAERIKILAGQFNRVWATYFGANASAPESAVRIALTRRNGEERNRVVSLSPRQQQIAAEIRQRTLNELENDQEVLIAGLSQALWKLMDEQ